MGHSSTNCIASGLGISGGPIRVLYLVQNAPGSRGVSLTDHYYFRSLPFKAEYDGYAGYNLPVKVFKDPLETCLRDVTLDLFRQDMAVLAAGENEVHESEVNPSRDLMGMHDASIDSRLRVRSYLEYHEHSSGIIYGHSPTEPHKWRKEPVPDFIPTLKNIQARLPEDVSKGVLISKTGLMHLYKIRLPIYGENRLIARAREALAPHFAVMETAGDLATVLLVGIHPEHKDAKQVYGNLQKGLVRRLPEYSMVRHAFIREDAWQQLLLGLAQDIPPKDGVKFFNEVQRGWNRYTLEEKERARKGESYEPFALMYMFEEREYKYDDPRDWWRHLYHRSDRSTCGMDGFGHGIMDHFKRVMVRLAHPNFKPLPELSKILLGLEGLKSFLGKTRKLLEPSHNFGPQDCEREEEFHAADGIANLAHQIHEEDCERRREV